MTFWTAGLQFNCGQRKVESIIMDVRVKFLDGCDKKRKYNTEYYGENERNKRRKKDKIQVA